MADYAAKEIHVGPETSLKGNWALTDYVPAVMDRRAIAGVIVVDQPTRLPADILPTSEAGYLQGDRLRPMYLHVPGGSINWLIV